MGLREQINRHKNVSIGISATAVAAVGVWIFMANAGTSIPRQQSFYTTDDGATLFADDAAKVPPFDHDGQPAVRAFVFTCDDGKHQFVQYLMKYSDQMKAQLEASHSQSQIKAGLVKKPGDGAWWPETDPRATKITQPTCPDGNNSGTYRQVFP